MDHMPLLLPTDRDFHGLRQYLVLFMLSCPRVSDIFQSDVFTLLLSLFCYVFFVLYDIGV